LLSFIFADNGKLLVKMKKILCWVFVTAVISGCYAQEFRTPDSKDIKDKITDSLSPFYYPLMLELFQHYPENLSADDYFYLYYGSAFMEGFSGYRSVMSDNQIYSGFNSKKTDYVELRYLFEAYLEMYPVNPEALMYYGFVLDRLGLNNEASSIYSRLSQLMQVILQSGDGMSEKTAYHVTSVRDEYIILEYLNYSMVGQSLLSSDEGVFDLMKIGPNADNIDGVYFNISLFFGKF